MASGVKLSDECVQAFERVKTRRSKFCLFKFNQKHNEVVFDKEHLCDKTDNKFDSYEGFLLNLPDDDCRYGAFDYSRIDHEDKVKEKLVFVSWAPANSRGKTKMVHASTLSAVKQKLQCEEILQATELDDLTEECVCSKLRFQLNMERLQKDKEKYPYRPPVATQSCGDDQHEQTTS